jgi:outer membrane protein OmpA-like peptidoglycan-associated protein
MTDTKRMLLGGAAVSLALATMAVHGLPVRAQEAPDIAACAELEGDALAACLAAEADPEAVGDVTEPEEDAADVPETDAEVEAERAPEAAEEVAPEPAEAAGADAPDAPQPAEAAEPDATAEELPEAAAEPIEEPPVAVEEDAPALPEATEADAVEDAAVDAPEAADEVEAEAEAVETIEATDDVEAVDAPEAVEDDSADMPEVGDEVEATGAPEPEGIDDTQEVEAVDAPEAVDEDEAAAEPEVADEATAAPEPEAIEATEEAEAVEEPEVVEEAEAVEEPEVVEEDAAVDAAEAEATAAEAVDPEDVLSEEELLAAQQESIEEAVQAALAAERQKPQAQQETESDDRMRILGAAAAGLAAGAILPQIGAMLVGQEGDRVILQQDERLIVRGDETARFLQDGSTATVEEFADGLSLVTVTRPDGTRILSWRDASGQVVRRVRKLPDGSEITLFDGLDTAAQPEIRVTELPPIRREEQRRAFLSGASPEELLRVLSAQPVTSVDDRFTLRQVLAEDQIRWMMPSLALDAVTFDTGSATLGTEEIRALDTMGRTLRDMVEDDPQEVFLVEGHTDAVGSDIFNLALSDRRAETVATLLSQYYQVPPENLLVQGFGEQDLRVPTLAASRDNRRVEIRRITPLLR